MTTWSAATGILLASVLSAASADRPPDQTAIEGPVWHLIRMRGQDEKGLAALRSGVTVRFDGGRVHGFGGCNQLMGSYALEGERVTLTALAGTMMACPPPQMAIETAFKRAFTGTLRFSIAANRLTFSAESDADPTLVFEAAPPPRLEGVTWKVTGFNNGRQAVVSPLIGTTLTLAFQDASVVGFAGCNRFRAKYTRDGNRLTVEPAVATRKVCAKKGVMEQERQFLAALESATTWAIDRDMLDLHRPDGERVLLASKSAK
jgi:heat shock protein HslJ